ncbi:MAG: MarR family transcriptional regulator [Pseudomonadota bacterium]
MSKLPSTTSAQIDIFRLMNEIGIINQLSSSAFERTLPHGLTVAQFSVLNHFTRLGDGSTPAQLASAFQVTRGTMTSTLKRLSEKGFVEITPDDKDGRSKRVYMTESGRAARSDGIAAATPHFARIVEALSAEERKAVIPILEKLRVWLDNNR